MVEPGAVSAIGGGSPSQFDRLPRRGAGFLGGVVATVLTVFCLLFAALALPQRAVAQGDVLYGALVLATNADHPEAPPEELRSQAANLHRVFGYNQFRLLGQKRKAVPTGTEDWLVSSPQFFLRVDTKNPVPGGYAVNLQLLKENKVLVEADTNLERNRPLFIRGPFVGQGQLIILLMVL